MNNNVTSRSKAQIWMIIWCDVKLNDVDMKDVYVLFCDVRSWFRRRDFAIANVLIKLVVRIKLSEAATTNITTYLLAKNIHEVVLRFLETENNVVKLLFAANINLINFFLLRFLLFFFLFVVFSLIFFVEVMFLIIFFFMINSLLRLKIAILSIVLLIFLLKFLLIQLSITVNLNIIRLRKSIKRLKIEHVSWLNVDD